MQECLEIFDNLVRGAAWIKTRMPFGEGNGLRLKGRVTQEVSQYVGNSLLSQITAQGETGSHAFHPVGGELSLDV